MRLAALLLAVTTAAAAAGSQWVKLTSDNFQLYTSAGEKRGREAITYFEQVRSFFLRALQIKEIPNTEPIRIVAFSGEKEYLPYQINEFAAAYYASDGRRDSIVMRGISPDSYQISVHEFTHLIIRYTKAKLPIWLNEGFADVYSTMKPIGKKVQVGDVIPGRLLELRESRWIDLETLTTVTHDSPYYNEKKRAGVFYAESWALTHMILLSPDYAHCKPRVTAMLMEGKPAITALPEACGKQLADVQKDLMHYVNGSRFFAAIFDIRLEKRAEAPDVAAVEPLESGMVLADLLTLIHKRAEARDRLLALAKENPKSWQPEAALAEIEWRENKLEEARRHFARAAELGSTDPQMYLDYSSVERGRSSLLLKALELKPGWQEAQYRLGLALISEGSYAEAVDRLRAIKKVTPDQAFHYFYGLAYASYRLGRKPETEKYVGQARQWAKQAEDRRLVEGLAGFIDPKAPPPATRPTDEGPPRLARHAGAPAQAAAVPSRPAETFEGALRQVDCLGETARVIVESNGKTARFAIMDPNKIVVRNATTGSAEFTCGPQKSQPVLLEYETKANAEMGTIGEIRAIEFR